MEKTIAAISTAPAPGGIGIVRISGGEAFAVAEKVFRGVSGKKLSQMKGYTAQLGGAYTPAGEKLDDVVALVYRGPKSYTGEDVVELSCHGGLYMTKRLLQLVLDAGAAPAGPGEFTRRAFLNGKMDLAQAEAVMGLISASGEQARKAALAGSTGVLSQENRVHQTGAVGAGCPPGGLGGLPRGGRAPGGGSRAFGGHPPGGEGLGGAAPGL